MARIEATILRNLIEDEDYARKVVPHLQPEYFLLEGEKMVFQKIIDFYRKYNKKPTVEALQIELGQEKKMSEPAAKVSTALLDDFKTNTVTAPDKNWLVDKTEEFCRDKALYNAMMESIQAMDGKSKRPKTAIPDLLKDALSVSFDPSVGHDYLEDADARYTYYTNVEEKLEFDVDILNKATNGGIGNKTLNMILAGVHVGKTAMMCSLAASYLLKGKNVLYITLEMSEEEISKRIDSNLLDIPMDELSKIPESFFLNKITAVKAKTTGRLKLKEFPTAGATVATFRGLINDLALKQNFKPDVIFIDYLNLCLSLRFKAGNSNSYEIVKAIAEEVRGLAIELELPIWSATQLNRGGMKSSDPEMTDVSESIGLPAVCDLLWAAYRNEEMDKQGHLMVKQLKNRYRDYTLMPRFLIGLDRVKMRINDVQESAQKQIQQDPDVKPSVSFSKPAINTSGTPKKSWNLE